jgi:hypothetical protein
LAQPPLRSVSRPSKTVVRVEVDASAKGFEWWVLLSSDRHHDNALCNQKAEKLHLEQAKERGAGIIDVGDLFCAMAGKYDPRSDRSQLREEHSRNNYFDRLVDTAAEFYAPYCENFIMMSPGNHECVDPLTEVLTRRGWIAAENVTLEDDVASLHPLTKTVHFAPPLKVHQYEYSGPMVHIKSRLVDMLVTPSHRIAYLAQGTGELCYRFAGTVKTPGSVFTIPTSGKREPESEYPLSDDMIRLAAWLVTDGCVSKGYSIYQSKPEMVSRIKELLDRAEIPHTFHERRREIREIRGTLLKAVPKAQCEFYLLKEAHPLLEPLQIATKEALPSWVAELSQRQFTLFLDEVVLGDGTRHKRHPNCPMVFGREPFLSSLQAVCVLNGYRATLSSGTRQSGHEYWVLHVSDRPGVAVHGRQFYEVAYSGPVYCLTTPSGNFFTRRNGRVCLTGNSSVLDRNGTNLTDRLADGMRTRSGAERSPLVGTYQGWVALHFKWGVRNSQTFKLRYTHGYGGGGPVTKDAIQAQRQLAYTENADFLLSGHTHDSHYTIQPREYLDDYGNTKVRNVALIKIGGYKDEFSGGAGWAVSKGMPPKPIGGWWLRFTMNGDRLSYKVTRTDDV